MAALPVQIDQHLANYSSKILPDGQTKQQLPGLAASAAKSHVLAGFELPESQVAVVTPIMEKGLNLHMSNIPVRRPNHDEVVVRIAWTGICRSDARFSVGPEPGYPTKDHIAGHEGIGHIVMSYDEELLGRPVAARYLAATCKTCAHCLRGVKESCPNQKNFPKHHNGTFQQYVTVASSSLMLLPEWVFDSPISPAAYTAALCSGSTALKAIRRSEIQPNDVIIIIGITGAIGHLAGLIAKHVYKAKVIGVDWAWKASAMSGGDVYDKFVATPVDAPSCSEFAKIIDSACAEIRGPSPVQLRANAVLVTISHFAAFDRVTDFVCDGGSVICTSAPKMPESIPLPLIDLIERQLKFQGNMMGGYEEAYQMLEYIRSRIIRPFITELGLENVGEHMKKYSTDASVGKTVVRVNGPLP
ncbi:chaperonin 10-like protein [Lipomyces kononenkoae]|uniref:Chaperonin 10-like protein n=1 Tax=Lipomyces kononenkoae TaxID=34357 RepID=A0ACC3SV43_LIPKO